MVNQTGKQSVAPPVLCLLCSDLSFVDGWVLNITQTSHEKIVMHDWIDKVCVKCSSQWDCLRGRCHIIPQRYTGHPPQIILNVQWDCIRGQVSHYSE